MYKYFIIILLVLFNQNVLSKSIFDTKFHEINFISNNVENDKNKKITEIKFISFKSILKNILISEDYNKIKRDINEDFINFYIKNIIVNDEKIINNNYYSNIKINFDKKKIINYLREKKFSYVEYLPEEFFVIIFEDYKLQKNLLSNNNSHYNFLINNSNIYNYFLTPKLDINDRYLLSPDDIKNKDIEKINLFLNKYIDKDYAIIIVTEINNKINYSIFIYKNNKFNEIKSFFINELNYHYFFKNLEKDLIDGWKKINYIQNTSTNNMICVVNYFNLLELKQIKSNINKITVIKDISLKNISYKSNIYDINYFGHNKMLPKLFNLNGLKIKFNNEVCKIYLK